VIDLDQLTSHLSDWIITRAKHCSAVKIRTGEYRITPMTRGFEKHHGKTKRRVQFILQGPQVKILCSDYYSGEVCEANEFKSPCCHCYAAYKQFLKQAEKEQKAA
jgi:hypothetical protein